MAEKEYTDHLIDQLTKDINELDKKKSELGNIRSKLTDYKINILNKFKCPLGLSNYWAICSECEHVLPKRTNMSSFDGFCQDRLIKPYGMTQELTQKILTNAEGCREWKKKMPQAACGCGGSASCICGYYEEFCYPNIKKCPFCERDVKIEHSKLWGQTKLILEDEK